MILMQEGRLRRIDTEKERQDVEGAPQKAHFTSQFVVVV